MKKVTPFLWFNDQAEEAAHFYTSVFKNSKVGSISRFGEDAPMPAGTVMVVEFQLDGQDFYGLNGGPMYRFTEAVSFVVDCETQEELDYFWEKLSEGGEIQACGWLKDKFGVSWQIIPKNLIPLMQSGDPKKAQNMMKALWDMTKLDMAVMQRAYDEG
jgi:predicted 3-demethylubiquinone-9 3-methyltransferase (glyoxalase superfamily)